MTPTGAAWLAEDDFTLVLGAGFFGFFAHVGLLLELEDAGLRPRRIVGVSAGALAGGIVASGLSASAFAPILLALRREEFWDPGFPWGGLLAGRKFAAKLQSVLAPTGIDALEDCPIPFSAVAFDVLSRRAVAISEGPLDSAILASCTVPGLFRPIWRQRRLLVDGGVTDREGRVAWDRRERMLVHRLPSRRGPGAPTQNGDIGAGLAWLDMPDLPSVHPYALERGAAAMRHARVRAREWLDRPLAGFPGPRHSVYFPSR